MESALARVLQDIRVTGASVGYCVLSARPLPTERRRVFIFVSNLASVTGEDLAEEAKKLGAKVEALPHHDLASFMDAGSALEAQCQSDGLASAVLEAAELSKYHGYYSQALMKAVKKKRVKSEETSLPNSDRVSVTDTALRAKTAWLKAQADVLQLVAMEKSGSKDLNR